MANEPDMTLLAELYEEIERNPPGIQARKLLVEQFITAGWMDAVRDAVQDLMVICNDEEVTHWDRAFCGIESSQPPPKYSSASASASATAPNPASTAAQESARRPKNPSISPTKLPTNLRDLHNEKQNLTKSYKAFQIKAKAILLEANLLRSLRQRKRLPLADVNYVDDLSGLADGRITTVLQGVSAPISQTTTSTTRQPDSARAVARKMVANPGNTMDLAISDLEAMATWLRSARSQPSVIDNNSLRELLAKRIRTIITALPQDLEIHAHTAMMHIEHELLGRKYVNDETMLGDTIAEIPRAEFYATEDNYAWSMDELVQAITSNNGFMRNPLSKHMFTPNDIRGILQHPRGKPLAALRVEQNKLKQGVRPKTIEEMDRMAKVFMEDMADDALKSREAVDEFLAYLATLPDAEQKAIDNLSVPAKDSHTGQAFDGTIGEAVRDAKANKLCFHKAGKFYFYSFSICLVTRRHSRADLDQCGRIAHSICFQLSIAPQTLTCEADLYASMLHSITIMQGCETC
jgi:hypothetical protein